MKGLVLALLAVVVTVGSGGCSAGYVLRGRAISAGFTDVTFVDPDHADLADGAGVANASVQLFRDPDTPKRLMVAAGRTDINGTITLEVNAFGAGWMDEEWDLEVVRGGYESVTRRVRLPSGKKRMLVLMRSGASVAPRQPDNLMEEYERFRR